MKEAPRSATVRPVAGAPSGNVPVLVPLNTHSVATKPPSEESEVTTAELNQVSKSAGASKSAAALVQAKQRELVKQYVQDWGFSHRQAFEEAKKNHPNVFAVDAVDLSTVQRSA